jgi:exosortase/archaeosortase family protein
MTAPVANLRGLLHPGDVRDREVARQLRTAVLGVGAVVLAFHYSLSTLVRTLQVDTPLAYLGLVPGISLVLVARRARTGTAEPDIHDRQVDHIIGIPLLVAAVLVNLLLPVRLAAMFWVWRLDLLALPLFVAGTVTLLFGVRTLWRLRVPVLFLFLAWPLPYTRMVLSQMDAFTAATLVGVRAGLHLLPGVAHQLPGDGSIFQIHHGADGFPVSVASACSGVNGLVGYGLVAGAFLFELRGAWWKRGLWLATGLAAVWVLNVARILAIFTAGHWWGQDVAIDALHPFIGLVTFNLAVVGMLVVMGRFGLSLRGASGGAAADGDGGSGDGRPAPAPSVGGRPPGGPGRRTRLATAIVVVLAVACGLANAELRSYDVIANLDGSPKLVAYQDLQGHPVGWRARKVADFGWSRQFFGKSSAWYRYDLAWDGITRTDFHTRTHVTVDVVSTTDPSRFQAYGVESCYRFHGYRLRAQRTVDLGGITGRVVSWESDTLDSTWTTVYWMWPVKSRLGTRYERVVMMLNDGAQVSLGAKAPTGGDGSVALAVQDHLGGRAQASHDDRIVRTQRFLVSLATETVRRQPGASHLP